MSDTERFVSKRPNQTEGPGPREICPNCGADSYGRYREFCTGCHYKGPKPKLLISLLCNVIGHNAGRTKSGHQCCHRCYRLLNSSQSRCVGTDSDNL